ncbi:multivesicular body subunit 12B [Nilaparvata lugens]|uniref:multivesicular body subunit 12B n=1 Tax=Nilaparvata lugens TaxID=108931 RepID=UPI00193D5469|nr:multivesicular body subunit 12B [Nilaparvata lugens]
MMQQVLKSFPDDKPITSICVVEDQSKCPPGFYVVSKTHDQDNDADLWKENSFFGRKVTRYLCLSKTEGISDYIVENLGVIGEKEMPPDGYCLIPKTVDSEQKCWRKRQICYRLTRKNLAASTITDIIILGKARKAPEGFSLAGDVNGMALCFKTGLPPTSSLSSPSGAMNGYGAGMKLGYSLYPGNGDGLCSPPVENGFNQHNNKPATMAPALLSLSPAPDYENLVRVTPTRPAPKPPAPPPPSTTSNYATIGNYQGLEGVPFMINPRYNFSTNKTTAEVPVIKRRTQFELEEEFGYDFRLERQYVNS